MYIPCPLNRHTFIFKSINVDFFQLSDSDESEELFIFNICSISKSSPDVSIDVQGVTWLDGRGANMLRIEGCLFFCLVFSFLRLFVCEINSCFCVSVSNIPCATGKASSSNH